MTIGVFRWNRAITAFMVGIALFFLSCQHIIPVKEESGVGESAPALHRMADKYLENGQLEEATSLFKRIFEEYPDYSDLPGVRYQIARVLYQLGKHKRSEEEALKWLKKYPRHSLKGDILLLLGETSMELGDNPQAFVWLLKAKEESFDNFQRQGEVNDKLELLINASKLKDFEQLKKSGVSPEYVPKVYHKMATFFMEQDKLEKAQRLAVWLMQSTADPAWVALGRKVLEEIKEEINVTKGVVGCLLPLSGPFAIYGEEVLNGIQLGSGMFGGPGEGFVHELVIRDTEGNSEKAVKGLEDLVKNEKIMAVIGPLSSRTAAAAAKKAQELGVPMIAITQKEGINAEGDMIFRNFLTPAREVKTLVTTAIDELGKRRFAILYPDNSYGRFFMNLFWDALEEAGGIVSAVESYDPDDTDFPDEIKKIIGLYYPRPVSLVQKLMDMRTPEDEENIAYPEEPEPIIDFDAVFIPDNFQRVAMITPQLVYHDVKGVLLMGTSLWQSPQLIATARDYVQGAIFPSGFFERSGESGVEAFVESYRDNFDSGPGILAATGYDTIRLLKHLMEDEAVLTRKDLQKALFQCPDFAGVTGMIFFNSQGDVEKEPLLLTVSGSHIILFR